MPAWAINLKKYRLLKGYSQEEFGKLFGVTTMAVSYWESARNEPPAKVLAWLLTARGNINGARLIGEGTSDGTEE